jgi:hypothetical protein
MGKRAKRLSKMKHSLSISPMKCERGMAKNLTVILRNLFLGIQKYEMKEHTSFGIFSPA